MGFLLRWLWGKIMYLLSSVPHISEEPQPHGDYDLHEALRDKRRDPMERRALARYLLTEMSESTPGRVVVKSVNSQGTEVIEYTSPLAKKGLERARLARDELGLGD